MVESTDSNVRDSNVRNITNGMLTAAPKIAKMKSDFLTEYVDNAHAVGDQKQLTKFGASENVTTESTKTKSITAVREAGNVASRQGTIFSSAALGQDGKRPADVENPDRLDGSGHERDAEENQESAQGIDRDRETGTVKEGGITYETTRIRNMVDLRDGSRGSIQTSDPVQAALFTAPSLAPKEKRISKRKLYAEVKHSSSGTFYYGGKAGNFSAISQIAATIMGEAQENNIATLTDENDVPIAVLRPSVGTSNSDLVQPPFIFGVAHSIASVKKYLDRP